jgi:hypothetical protein
MTCPACGGTMVDQGPVLANTAGPLAHPETRWEQCQSCAFGMTAVPMAIDADQAIHVIDWTTTA